MYQKFEAWLNETLNQELPEDIVAFNFNLYENGDNNWSMELVGTEEFDTEDEDWVCEEVFDNRETPFCWEQEEGWEEALETAKQMVEKYLQCGEYQELFKSYEGIGIGFVDGDIEILYTK